MSFPTVLRAVAHDWRTRCTEPLVETAVAILTEKFKTVEHDGSRQLAVFHDSPVDAERAMHARRAFEFLQRLLSLA